MSAPRLHSSRRQRSTPFKSRVEALGVSGYSVVNHTILPKGYKHSVEEDYWHLREHVQLWDVGCQRQVEMRGVDAARLAQLMTPRNLGSAKVGQCLYAPVVDDSGGMLNDPIILKLAEDHFWFSIADSDLLLWAKGLAVGLQLEVALDEPDVWPIAVQGPKAEKLMTKVFGGQIQSIGFFKFDWFPFQNTKLLIARSGYSKQGGFEIYLSAPELAEPLWDTLWDAGEDFHIRPGSPNVIERVEGGLLSYGNEMSLRNNPFECGLDQYVSLDDSVDYIGKQALRKIHADGVERKICGLQFGDTKCPPCSTAWTIKNDDCVLGEITSAIWSPRFNTNVALGMVDRRFRQPGTAVQVIDEDKTIHQGYICELPMK